MRVRVCVCVCVFVTVLTAGMWCSARYLQCVPMCILGSYFSENYFRLLFVGFEDSGVLDADGLLAEMDRRYPKVGITVVVCVCVCVCVCRQYIK